MMDVNYKAPVAAAQAATELKFGHWVQSSTQATRAERAGQVMYSRAKAMADSALSRMEGRYSPIQPFTIFTLLLQHQR